MTGPETIQEVLNRMNPDLRVHKVINIISKKEPHTEKKIKSPPTAKNVKTYEVLEVRLENDGKIEKDLTAKKEPIKKDTNKKLKGVKDKSSEKKTADNLQLELEKKNQTFMVKEILKNSNATLLKNMFENGYHCYYCSKIEPTAVDLKRHTIEEHSNSPLNLYAHGAAVSNLRIKLDITDLKCELCSIEIDSLESLKEHLVNSHEIPLDLELKNHIVPIKFDDGELKCCMCEHVEYFMNAIVKHMNVHYPNFRCKVGDCTAAFMTKSAQRAHVKHAHTSLQLKCRYCPEMFTKDVIRRLHEKHTHGARIMMSTCHICGMKFNDYTLKLKHTSEVHGAKRSYKCNACDGVFTSASGLRTHVKRVHLMDRRHQCSVCDKGFLLKNQLDDHMICHTGGDRKFECDYCSKVFNRQKGLKQHIRIHLDDRRYKCQICGMSFVHKNSLKGHLKARHGP